MTQYESLLRFPYLGLKQPRRFIVKTEIDNALTFWQESAFAAHANFSAHKDKAYNFLIEQKHIFKILNYNNQVVKTFAIKKA